MSKPRSGTADRGVAEDPRYRFLARFGSVILSGGIAAVPRALYFYQAELGLLPQEVWFVGYILAHRWTAELPYPSLRKMARRTGVTYQMLHRYKNSLIAKDYLEVIPRTRQNGGRTTNSYDFSGLFQAIETLLLRDRGVMDEALDEADPDPDEPIDSGQPELTAPDPPSLTRSRKPRLTAPDPLGRTTGRDPNPTLDPPTQKETQDQVIATTTTERKNTAGAADAGGPVGADLNSLYEAANGRSPSALQVQAVADLAADLDARLGPGEGAGWVAAAIHEAADAGSRYVSPRLLRRICDRWLQEGRPGASGQSLHSERTGDGASDKDWIPLPAEKWTAAIDRLAASLSAANFQAFVAPARPIGTRGDRVCLAVPDDLTAQRLTGSFRSVVEAALTAAIGRRIRVECRVGPRDRAGGGPIGAVQDRGKRHA